MTESKVPTILQELRAQGFATAGVNELVLFKSEAPGLTYAVAITDNHGLQVEELDYSEGLRRPFLAEGTQTVVDTASFLAAVRRRRGNDEETTFWGNRERGVIGLVYDDHDSTGCPGNRVDRLLLELDRDPDWTAWHQLSGTYMGQEKLAEFIEDRRHTIVDPSAADMLMVARTLKASTKGTFENRVEPSDGSYKVGFTQDVNTSAGRKGELEVPQTLVLSLQPYEGVDRRYEVRADFRLRVRDGELSVAIKLEPTRELERQAWSDVCALVEAGTSRTIFQTSDVL